MQGIQDGTLPADVETAVSDAAGSSSSARAIPGSAGGTSLDRLVLNQLVTVLQATSALSGATAAQGSSQVCHTLHASCNEADDGSSYMAVAAQSNLLLTFWA